MAGTGPGSVLLLPPGRRQYWQASPGTLESAIIFRLAGDPDGAGGPLWGSQPPEILHARLAERIRPRLTTISALWWRSQLERIRAHGLLAIVLTDILAAQAIADDDATLEEANVDPRVVDAERLARSRLDSWTVEDMADVVGMKRSAFTALFKLWRGQTPGAWLDEARLSFAQVRLADPDASIAHVARSTGHPRLQSFGRWFKLRTGLSPSAYRAAHR
jgi:AraC-like DNA-binding protein